MYSSGYEKSEGVVIFLCPCVCACVVGIALKLSVSLHNQGILEQEMITLVRLTEDDPELQLAQKTAMKMAAIKNQRAKIEVRKKERENGDIDGGSREGERVREERGGMVGGKESGGISEEEEVMFCYILCNCKKLIFTDVLFQNRRLTQEEHPWYLVRSMSTHM